MKIENGRQLDQLKTTLAAIDLRNNHRKFLKQPFCRDFFQG